MIFRIEDVEESSLNSKSERKKRKKFEEVIDVYKTCL